MINASSNIFWYILNLVTLSFILIQFRRSNSFQNIWYDCLNSGHHIILSPSGTVRLRFRKYIFLIYCAQPRNSAQQPEQLATKSLRHTIRRARYCLWSDVELFFSVAGRRGGGVTRSALRLLSNRQYVYPVTDFEAEFSKVIFSKTRIS